MLKFQAEITDFIVFWQKLLLFPQGVVVVLVMFCLIAAVGVREAE